MLEVLIVEWGRLRARFFYHERDVFRKEDLIGLLGLARMSVYIMGIEMEQ